MEYGVFNCKKHDETMEDIYIESCEDFDPYRLEDCVFEMWDYKRIEKLRSIKTLDGYNDKVRKLTKNVHSDHAIRRWEILAEVRETEIRHGIKV